MARSQTWEEQLAGARSITRALEELRDSFDTYRLLDAVDAVDAIRYRLCEPEQVRDGILHLHDVASALISSGGLNGRRPRQPIWSLASDLSLELDELGTLEALVGLPPGEDELATVRMLTEGSPLDHDQLIGNQNPPRADEQRSQR
jgi:hypothetical protein